MLCVCVVWWCCCGVGEALSVFACVRAMFVFCLSPASVLCFVLACMVLACSMVILACGFTCEVEFGGGRLSLGWEGGVEYHMISYRLTRTATGL